MQRYHCEHYILWGLGRQLHYGIISEVFHVDMFPSLPSADMFPAWQKSFACTRVHAQPSTTPTTITPKTSAGTRQPTATSPARLWSRACAGASTCTAGCWTPSPG